MTLKTITAEAARQRISQGAVLIDIRSADEHARQRIDQALNVPLDQLANGHEAVKNADCVIFHCASGNRTRLNAKTLEACADCETYVLEGGLDAWKAAGLPTVVDASQPLELQRQVQIAAGSMIVLGTVLGAVLSPWWLLVSGFVGAGLVFAGVSGFCGLARLLMKMPWNQRALAR